jgi:hypothetical protein
MQFQMSHALEVLAQTPAVLAALLRGKSPVWLNSRRTPESFSPLDVLGHLMHLETVNWIPRVRMILDHHNTQTFEPFDRFAFQHIVAGKPVETLLDEFAGLRKQSLQTIHELGISESQLDLPGKHPDFGPVKLSNLLAAWVVHDLGHTSQIVKAMASEYSDAVGPWRAYLSILD